MEKETGTEKSLSLETFKSNLESVRDLINNGFLTPGYTAGLGELCEAPSMDMTIAQTDFQDGWNKSDIEEREKFLRKLLIELDLDPDKLTSERAKTTFFEEGIRGEPSEDGADVFVFNTRIPQLDLHVYYYRNELIGKRYNLVVVDN